MKTALITLLVFAMALSGQAQTYSKKRTSGRKTGQKTSVPPARPQAQEPPKADPKPVAPAVQAHVLHIFAENGEKFFLILDGEKINAEPKAKVTARDLDKGYYRGKIIFEDERLPDVDANLQLEGVDPGWNEVTYRIKKKVKKGKTTYSIPAMAATWKKIGDAAPTPNQERLQEMEREHAHQDMSDPVPPPAAPAVPCGQGLPEPAFQGLLTSVESASFEDMKVSNATMILEGNCLTALQIKQIIQKFGYEDSRLDFARTAYKRCLDKHNYMVVNEGLQYTMSKKALNEYVLEQKK